MNRILLLTLLILTLITSSAFAATKNLYENSYNGYRITLPAGWTANPDMIGKADFVAYSPSGSCGIAVNVEPTPSGYFHKYSLDNDFPKELADLLTPEYTTKLQKRRPYMDLKNTQFIRVAGKKALSIDYAHPTINGHQAAKWQSIILFTESKGYFIQFMGPENEYDANYTYFLDALKSFKLLS